MLSYIFRSAGGFGFSRSSSAALTSGETELVRGIFGDSVDTPIVTKYFVDTDPHCAAVTISRKGIKFCGPQHFSKDYSKEAEVNFGIFIHEMTHIWQKQTNSNTRKWRIYDYNLSAQSCFDGYCLEQQAAIVEDYARRFLHPSHQSRWIKNTPESDLLLQKVVEDKFPQARATRLAYAAWERGVKVADAAPKSLVVN